MSYSYGNISSLGLEAIMSNDDVSMEDIEKAYLTAAYVVKKFGDAYIHTFKRLHEELELRTKNSDLFSLALEVAREYNPPKL